MSSLENLVEYVKAGDTLKPWIMLGPFNHDVSSKVVGLSYFENKGSVVGRTAMNEVVDEALKILALAPTEGQETNFRGEVTRWTLCAVRKNFFRGARTTSQTTWARRFYPLSLRPIKPECGSGDCSSTMRARLCSSMVPSFSTARIFLPRRKVSSTHITLMQCCSQARMC